MLAQQRQQRIPHAALAPAGKGVADLFPGSARYRRSVVWQPVACTQKMALIMSRALRTRGCLRVYLSKSAFAQSLAIGLSLGYMTMVCSKFSL
nr:hypothetical protein [uncultured Ottowia sp.]